MLTLPFLIIASAIFFFVSLFFSVCRPGDDDSGVADSNDIGTREVPASPPRASHKGLTREEIDKAAPVEKYNAPSETSKTEDASQDKSVSTLSTNVEDSKERSNSNGTCSVCLEDFKEGDRVRRIARKDCGHLFHSSCIRRWLRRRNKCPLCVRTVVTKRMREEEFEQGTSEEESVSPSESMQSERIGENQDNVHSEEERGSLEQVVMRRSSVLSAPSHEGRRSVSLISYSTLAQPDFKDRFVFFMCRFAGRRNSSGESNV